MGLIKNSKLYNLLNEEKPITDFKIAPSADREEKPRNQSIVELRYDLIDPVEGIRSISGMEDNLKNERIRKSFNMASVLLDKLAIVLYNRQGSDEFNKEKELIGTIIGYLRDLERDIYIQTPGPSITGNDIARLINRLITQARLNASDYPTKITKNTIARAKAIKNNSNLEGLSFDQKYIYSDLVLKYNLSEEEALKKIQQRESGISTPDFVQKEYEKLEKGIPSEDSPMPYYDEVKKEVSQPHILYYVKDNAWWFKNLETGKSKRIEAKYAKNIENLNKAFGANIKVGDTDVDSQETYISEGDYAEKLAKLLRSYEGFRSKAYKDPRGIPTIGIGATWYPDTFKKYSGKVQMGQTVTEEEALFIKSEHVKFFQKKINKEIGASNFNALPDNVKAALQSKAFNYGSLGKILSSKIKQGIELNDFSEVAKYFKDVLAKHNNGINDWRRKDEAGIIESGLSKRTKISFNMGNVKPIEKGPPLPYVYIADSQGNSGLGEAIKEIMGPAIPGENFFQYNGATAAVIMTEFGEKIKVAVRNTQNIILTLGGNGSSKASYLAKDILENAPESAKITWILAPPAVEPTSSTIYVNTPGKPERQVDKYKATRAKYNKEITTGIKAVEAKLGMINRINIIDPYPWFEQNVKSSYDGVHVDRKYQNSAAPGEKYIASIKSEIQPASQNAVATAANENFVISETNLKTLLSMLLNENVAQTEPKDKKEGDKFRNWVNDNYSQKEIADLYDDLSDNKLDRSGAHNNEYVKRAWRVYGDKFLEYNKLERVAGKEKARHDRGIPNEFFKFKRGKDVDKSQEVYALDVAGNIYIKNKKSNKFQKLNEKKIFMNESKTKVLIVESDFDLANEFLKDLQAMGLDQDPEIDRAIKSAIDNMDLATIEPGNKDKDANRFIPIVEVTDKNIIYDKLIFQSIASPKIVDKAKQLYSSFSNTEKDQESLNKWREKNIYSYYDKKYLNNQYTNEGEISRFSSTEASPWSSWFLNICAMEDPIYSSQMNFGKLWISYPINSKTNSDKLGLFDLKKAILENPDRYEGKTYWVPFDIDLGIPVVPGDMISAPRKNGNHMRIFTDSNGTVIGGNEGYHGKGKGIGGGMGKGSVKLNEFGAPIPGQTYSGYAYRHILKKVYVVGSTEKDNT